MSIESACRAQALRGPTGSDHVQQPQLSDLLSHGTGVHQERDADCPNCESPSGHDIPSEMVVEIFATEKPSLHLWIRMNSRSNYACNPDLSSPALLGRLKMIVTTSHAETLP